MTGFCTPQLQSLVRRLLVSSAVVGIAAVAGCSYYKPEVTTNKCVGNEECGEGFACRSGRCEDIYYPKRKIRQY